MIWIKWVWLLYPFHKNKSQGGYEGQLLMWWPIIGFAEMFTQQLNKYAVVILLSQFSGLHIFTLSLQKLSTDREVCNFWGHRMEKYSSH